MAIEIEAKLLIQEHDIPRFKACPELAGVASTTRTLLTSYYDTPQQELRRHGFALRIRQDTNRIIQTVKTRHKKGHAELAERQEWEWELTKTQPDFTLFPDMPLRDELIHGQLGNKIQALFTTEFSRCDWLLTLTPSTQVMVSLDQGFVRYQDKQQVISEVEIELIAGDVNALLALARHWQHTYGLELSQESKASRGYQLVRG